MQRINNDWEYTVETVEEYFARCDRVLEPPEKNPYAPLEELRIEIDINSSVIAKKAAKRIIRRCKDTEKEFSYTIEARKNGISPITLKKYLLKQLENTGYVLVSTSRRTCIQRKDQA